MNKNILILVGGILILALFGFGLFQLIPVNESRLVAGNNEEAINSDNYQAVFLTNDQVYFGKLSALDTNYPVLSDVYYLVEGGPVQVSQPANLEEVESEEGGEVSVAESIVEAGSEPGFTLVKLGREIHGPKDSLILNKDHIMFIENLRDDGKLAQAIFEAENMGQEQEQPSEE